MEVAKRKFEEMAAIRRAQELTDLKTTQKQMQEKLGVSYGTVFMSPTEILLTLRT